jgi:hypothetical protein
VRADDRDGQCQHEHARNHRARADQLSCKCALGTGVSACVRERARAAQPSPLLKAQRQARLTIRSVPFQRIPLTARRTARRGLSSSQGST